jgi:RNA polymerase sigma factor (sigma-70 family)
VAENVRFGVWIAAKYAPLARDADGVFSASMAGLIEAAEIFNPALGTFGAIAGTTCRHAIFSELKRQRRTLRETALYVVLPSGDEAERADLPPVPPPDVEPPLMLARMWVALEDLPALERQILELRWGLTGEEHAFPAIGAALGIPVSTARRLEAKALARLRRTLSGRSRFRDRPAWGYEKP